ncbi:MAG: M1 family metallopeptidase [Defluviitaleaceae bacterium]|nr:M1 family metallopeptidase [Defluviitaleaceae bacterium]
MLKQIFSKILPTNVFFATLLSLVFIGFLGFFTACGDAVPPEELADVPVPPVIIADISETPELPILLIEDPPPAETIVIPLFNDYFVSLDLNEETRQMHGMQSVTYTNRTSFPLTELVFRVPLNAWRAFEPVQPFPDEFFNRIFRQGKTYANMNIVLVSHGNDVLDFQLSGTVLTITLPIPLEPNETIQILIQFDAIIPNMAHRTGSNSHTIWGGAFLPFEAVFDGTEWHTEPFYAMGNPFLLNTVNYVVEINTPINYIVAGPGTKTQVSLEEESRMITTFNAPMIRDFAFAISPHFQRATTTTPAGQEIILYHFTADIDTERILGVASESVTFFEETIGPLPYQQLNIVETDMFRNAENFSAVIFMDSNHLRTSQTLTSLRNEIGHQWFSVVVGTNPIEEAWLSGGLVMFLHEGLLGEPQALRTAMEREQNYLISRQGVVENDYLRRISNSIAVYESWLDYFRIQHRKSQLMFYSLYHEMGEENFRHLLREYYNRFAFSRADSTEFIALAEEIHGRTLQRFFYFWLNTTQLPNLAENSR